MSPSAIARKFELVDWVVFAYTAWVLLLALVLHEHVGRVGWILGFHAAVLAAMLLLPARGSRWEGELFGDGWGRFARGGLKFFRHSYPLLLILFFFEEVQHTVGAVYPDAPYWFERDLYAWDRSLFGQSPAILLNDLVGMPQDEIFHAFYFSYYLILIGGVAYAYLRPVRGPRPGKVFQTTLATGILAFVLCYVWYPFLPARGPWESPELMAGMTPFEGFFFTPLIERIIAHGAVSGGCFPSAHVAGSWGITFGLLRFERRAGALFAFFATGLSLSCIYTRYHHAVDVPAGLAAASVAALVVRFALPSREEEKGAP